ncbi:MAG TPA: Mur ligase family protein, partial [Acidimicrobiales bacterium]|nr:Mur ligase family protein [Acidimicrobiales bacterium]
MRQPISWSALAEATVGVWGLGVEGQASIRRLGTLGVTPILVDDAPRTSEIDGHPVLSIEPDGLQALLACDVVIKSPGISRYRAEVAQLEHAGVAVCGGLGLFMAEADPARVACITGTKGKSTTTAIAVHLLRGLGYDARAGGNIGRPPWDPSQEGDPEYWIVETSSFQVPDLAVAPHVVAVTSLSPDHLDWHGTVERYYADKLSLCTKTGVRIAVADGSDERLRGQAAQMGSHVRWVEAEEVARDGAWSGALELAGAHNARNA